MRKLILIPMLLFALASCKHKPTTVDQQLFPPPVVKADNEVYEKEPPTVEELKAADPGPKDQKGDATAAIRIDEPVGNADVKAVAEYAPSPAHGSMVKDTSKKIIKEGDISFETSNIKQTRAAIITALKKTGGYLSQENETNDGEDGRKEYVLKTRIPARYFDQFLSDVSATAVKIDTKNISMRDVTTQYIDMSTRLQNKKLLEARYLSLLKQANKMGDILEVESKLTEIRSDIESEQGQLNYLGKQVAYSSLDITFYTKHIDAVDKPYGMGDKFIGAIAHGWELLQNLFFGIVGLWPIITIATLLFWLFKRWRKSRKNAAA